MDWQLTETRHQGRHINGQTLVINFKNSKIRRITMHFPQKFTFFQHLSHNSSWNPIFYVRWSGFFMIDERYVFSCRAKKKANFFFAGEHRTSLSGADLYRTRGRSNYHDSLAKKMMRFLFRQKMQWPDSTLTEKRLISLAFFPKKKKCLLKAG